MRCTSFTHKKRECKEKHPYTKKEAVTRAAAVLDSARKCPVCKGLRMCNIPQYQGIQFPATQLRSCKDFRELTSKRKAMYLLHSQEGGMLP